VAKKKNAVTKRTTARTASKTKSRKSATTGKTTATSKTARRKTAARAAASRPGVKKASAKKKGRLASAASAVRGVVAGAVQAVAGSFLWSADENDPIALLESDHRRFEDLMKKGEETTERAVKGRAALLDTLTAALDVHELIEEKILYPALKPHAETRDIVLEGFQEHHVADVLVKELHQVAKDDEQWGAKFKVLQESLEHHIKEEENTMFPGARRVLTREELQDLGARMRKLKAEEERRLRP
jgi:hemerythrin-like domain-containing protein